MVVWRHAALRRRLRRVGPGRHHHRRRLALRRPRTSHRPAAVPLRHLHGRHPVGRLHRRVLLQEDGRAAGRPRRLDDPSPSSAAGTLTRQARHRRAGDRGQRTRRRSASPPRSQQCEGGPSFRSPPTSRTSTPRPQQTQATVSGLIDGKVTTVTCMCDPIAPGVPHHRHDQQRLLPRIPAARAWACSTTTCSASSTTRPRCGTRSGPATCRARRRSTRPTRRACGARWATPGTRAATTAAASSGPTRRFVAAAIMTAGPNLNALSVEQGILTSRTGTARRNRAHAAREVRAQRLHRHLRHQGGLLGRATRRRRSTVKRGAYVPLNDAARYELGELVANGLTGIPVADG